MRRQDFGRAASLCGVSPFAAALHAVQGGLWRVDRTSVIVLSAQ
jgi:hypothetical protein